MIKYIKKLQENGTETLQRDEINGNEIITTTIYFWVEGQLQYDYGRDLDFIFRTLEDHDFVDVRVFSHHKDHVLEFLLNEFKFLGFKLLAAHSSSELDTRIIMEKIDD